MIDNILLMIICFIFIVVIILICSFFLIVEIEIKVIFKLDWIVFLIVLIEFSFIFIFRWWVLILFWDNIWLIILWIVDWEFRVMKFKWYKLFFWIVFFFVR